MSEMVKRLAAASLTVLLAFPNANAAIVQLPTTSVAASASDFDRLVLAPVAFLTPLLWSETRVDAGSFFNTLAPTLVTFQDAPLWSRVDTNPSDIDTAVTVHAAVLVPPIPAKLSGRPIASEFAAFYAPQHQRDVSVDRISFDTPSLAPMAFVRFCMRYPQECDIQQTETGLEPIVLTHELMTELAQVNHDVNHAIAPQANFDGVMAEEWLISPHAGDCHDYAVTKRHELLARGWPINSLLLVEVMIPSGEHHLVLVVRTREGDFVLDNLNVSIRSIAQTRYRLVRSQQINNPKFWSTAKLTHAAQVAMNAR